MVRAAALGLLPFIVGCTSLGDLSDYGAGAAASAEPQSLNPDASAGSGTGGSGAGVSGTGGSGTTPLDASVNTGGTTNGEGARPTVVDPPDPPAMSGDPSRDASAAEPEPTPVALPRFVRLVADADVSLTPYTSVADFNVLDTAGAPIARAGWVASADSAESTFVGGAPPQLAIDDDPLSMWHTPWSDPALRPPHPHFLQVDLGAARDIGGFRYLPRQDGSSDGSITDYRFFVSVDGVEWGEPVAQGRFDATASELEVRLAR